MALTSHSPVVSKHPDQSSQSIQSVVSKHPDSAGVLLTVSTFRLSFPTIFKMAGGNLIDRLVWQFRHLWRDGNKARLSIESDHDGSAYASLHVDLGQGRSRPRQAPPPLPTHPPKSRHSQTPPVNIVKDSNGSTQVVINTTLGKSVTPSDVGTQTSDTVEVEVETATDTVEDNLIGVDNNVGKEAVETLTEVVLHNSDISSQPTITLSLGENENEGTKGAASEVANDDMDEEKEAEGDDATDDENESLAGFSPNEEGANTTSPATPLGKKVVTAGREEGPDEGEPWRLAASRRRRRSSTDEAQHARLCALAQQLNHYFLQNYREDIAVGKIRPSRWNCNSNWSSNLIPRYESFTMFMTDHKVVEKDADSLTSEWRKLGVDSKIGPHLDKYMSKTGTWRRNLF